MSKRKSPEGRKNQTITEAEFLERLKVMDIEEHRWAIKMLKYPVKFEELKKRFESAQYQYSRMWIDVDQDKLIKDVAALNPEWNILASIDQMVVFVICFLP